MLDGAWLGATAALLSAATWSVASLLVRSQTGRLSALTLNVLRSGTASLLLLTALARLRPPSLSEGIPLWVIGFLLLSALAGPLLGDTLFFESMRLVGVARAMTLSSTNPLFAGAFAVLLLGEQVTPRAALGTVLVVAGIWLVVGRGEHGPVRDARLGAALALAAAVLWGLATVAVGPALRQVEPLVASAIRLPATTLAVFLYGASLGRLTARHRLRPRTVAPVVAAGVIS